MYTVAKDAAPSWCRGNSGSIYQFTQEASIQNAQEKKGEKGKRARTPKPPVWVLAVTDIQLIAAADRKGSGHRLMKANVMQMYI